MSDRFAVLSGGQVSPDGRHLLILPNDVTELVDPGVTDDELTRHDLDSIVRVPKAAVYRAAFLDGPRAGQETWIAANKAGERVQS